MQVVAVEIEVLQGRACRQNCCECSCAVRENVVAFEVDALEGGAALQHVCKVAWSCARSAPWAAQSTVGEAQVCEVGNLDEFFCDEVKTIGSDANGGEIEVSEDRRSG